MSVGRDGEQINAPEPDSAGARDPDLEDEGALETAADVRAESVLLEKAIGGWRGIIDSGLPTLVFVVAYLVTSSNLSIAVFTALGAGLLVVAYRLIRRQPLRQVLSGFVGVAISAAFAKFTGRAENYFIPGFLQNLAYGSAFLISIVVRWPLLGVGMGFLSGQRTAWRHDARLRHVYSAASWIWVGLFCGRLVVQVPLYLANDIAVLGVLKVVMGIPLYIAAAWFTYRLLAPVWREQRQA
jgi:hypothetical protein